MYIYIIYIYICLVYIFGILLLYVCYVGKLRMEQNRKFSMKTHLSLVVATGSGALPRASYFSTSNLPLAAASTSWQTVANTQYQI